MLYYLYLHLKLRYPFCEVRFLSDTEIIINATRSHQMNFNSQNIKSTPILDTPSTYK